MSIVNKLGIRKGNSSRVLVGNTRYIKNIPHATRKAVASDSGTLPAVDDDNCTVSTKLEVGACAVGNGLGGTVGVAVVGPSKPPAPARGRPVGSLVGETDWLGAKETVGSIEGTTDVDGDSEGSALRDGAWETDGSMETVGIRETDGVSVGD